MSVFETPSDLRLYPGRTLAPDIVGRLYRSSGTRPGPELAPDLGPFLPRARLPLRPWTALRLEEIEALFDATGPYSRTIALARLPPELCASIEDLRPASHSDGVGRHAKMRRDPTYQPVMAAVGEFLRTWSRYGALPEDVFMSVNRAGLVTTCWTGAEEAWVGLHVDDWLPMPPCEREFGPNRMMMNAGLQPRHLVFLDRSVSAMADEVNRERARHRQPPLELRAGSPHEVGLEFMETFPNYPVMRLRVEPGEAYIAPTDNVVHDGSTFDMCAKGAFDLVLCAMGYFEPSAASAT